MGRVEKRMYKRRRRRIRWLAALAMILAACAVLLLRERPFISESIGQPAPSPVARAYDATVETREVTLNAETWYAIQTGVYSTPDAAGERAGAFASRGAPGTVIQEGDKWRVFIACYGSEADAASVRTRLGDRQQVDTYLYSWSCPEVRLRLTGQAGQLDVVEAGFTLLPSAAAALRDAAMLLDAGQLTTAEAAAQAEALASQMTLWAKTARERFGHRIPDLVQAMLTLTEGFETCVQAIRSAEKSATTLSAELKGQAMSLYDSIVTWRSALNGQ